MKRDLVFLVTYLKQEYPQNKSMGDLIDTLQNCVKHDLNDDQFDELIHAKNIKEVSNDVLKLVAKSLYIDQIFI